MIGRIYSEAVYSGVYNNIVLMACEKIEIFHTSFLCYKI